MKLLGGATVLSTIAAPLLWAPPALAVDISTLTASSAPDYLSLDITWVPDAVGNVDHFEVWADGPDADTNADASCANPAAADTTCTIVGLKANTQYTVKVVAKSAADTDLKTATVAAGTTTKPSLPLAPTAVNATATGNSGEVNVSWTPADNHDAELANFTAKAYINGSDTGKSCTSASGSTNNCKITGLTDNTQYAFKVMANGANATGNSLISTASDTATPSVKPGAPTNVSAIATDDGGGGIGALVSWTAPAETTGAAVNTYDVVGYSLSTGLAVTDLECPDVPATRTWCDPTTEGANPAPLTLGQSYYFKVTATTAATQTSAATQSNTVLPTTPPDPVTSVVAVAGSGKATVTWEAPAAGEEVGSYLVTAFENGTDRTALTCTSTTVTCSVTGLTNDTAYTFKVMSISALGTGTSSVVETSNSVTPEEAPVPGVPTGVTVTAGVGQLTVNWTAATTNPAPATGFTATASPGDATCSTASAATTTCTIVGLTAGTAYTVKVLAHGADGDSAESTASAAATPLSPSSGNTVSNANGQLQIFVRGTNDHLYTSIRATDGSWGAAVDLGYPIVSTPTVVRNANGKLEVFVLGYGHTVYHRQQTEPNSTTWSAWATAGAGVWTSNFVVEANADGSLQLFGRDASGNVRTAKQTTAGGADWTELGSLGGIVYSDPTVASTGGKLEVFAVGWDGNLWHRMQSDVNSATWSAWSRVGSTALTSIL